MAKAQPVTDEVYLNPEFKLEDWLDKEGGMNIQPTPYYVLKLWTV